MKKQNQTISKMLAYFLAFAMIFQSAGAVFAEAGGVSAPENSTQVEQLNTDDQGDNPPEGKLPDENQDGDLDPAKTIIPTDLKQYTFEAKWYDNNELVNDETSTDMADRPKAEDFTAKFKLYYSLDGGENYVALDEETMKNLGLEELPAEAVDTTSNIAIWKYIFNLPSTITIQNGEGQDDTVIPVTYLMQYVDDEGEPEGIYGYTDVAYERSEDGTTIAAKYTALQNWNATILWYDASVVNEARPSTEDIDKVYKVYRYVEGDMSTLEEMDPSMLQVESEGKVWDLSLKDAPGWNEIGDPYVYYVVQDEEGKGVCKDPKYGEYTVTYDNVNNYSAQTSQLFINGAILNLIVNETTFTAYKEWEDDNATNRPSGKIYLYRIIDKAGKSVPEAVGEANPVQGFDNAAVPTSGETIEVVNADNETLNVYEITFGESADGTPMLPMYDNRGNKYIYFGLETGIGGEYVRYVDNRTSDELERMIEAFDGITENGRVKYVLNEGIITNDREGSKTIKAGKLFKAQSMQSFQNTSVTYKLQVGRVDSTGKTVWTDATEADVISYDADNTTVSDKQVAQTITGFKGEAMGQNASGTVVNKYDEATGAVLTYRWVEISMSVNGSDSVDVYDANGNKVADTVELAEDENGNVLYKEVNVGEVGPAIDGVATTARFQPTTTNNTDIVNTLVGDYQIKIHKEWYDNGKNVSGELTEAEVTFIIIRVDDGASTNASEESGKKLIDTNGNPVDNVVLTINDLNDAGTAWERIIGDFPRYDENGKEYRYEIAEAYIRDSRTWGTDYTISVAAKPSITKSEEIVPELAANYVNTRGPGEVLYFNVEKQWLDDSDLLTRKPISLVLYRKDDNGDWTKVRDIVLDETNNWKVRFHIPKNGANDNVNNYLVKEIYDGTVGVEYVDFNGNVLSDNQIKNIAMKNKASYEYENRVGIIAEDNSYFDEATPKYEKNAIDYNYNVYVEESDSDNLEEASYRYSDQRVGSINLELNKTWKAGNVVYDAVFELYRDDELVDLNELIDAGIVTIKGDAEIGNNGELILLADGVKSNKISVDINDLPKYDTTGRMYDYTLVERGMRKDGDEIKFVNRKATVDGETYVSSLAPNADATKIAGREGHHTGDKYVWDGSNTRTETYTLEANKVWRDDGTKYIDDSETITVRPDVSFNLYRVSMKGHEDLEELVLSGDTKALAEELDNYATKKYLVSGDHFWDTKHNDWFWSVNLGTVQRYDAEGFKYIYFLQEVYTGSAGNYSEAYCNLNYTVDGYQPVEKPSEEKFTTKEVFGVESSEFVGPVAILSDGVHAKQGDYGNYYSTTTVNTRQDERTISGKKIWRVPEGWTLAEGEMPTVEIEVYRFSTPIRDENGKKLSEVTQDQLNAKIAEEGADVVNKVTLGEGNYSFMFKTDLNDEELQRYDEWGRSYQYYVSEKSTTVGYPTSKITISSSNFTVANVYDPTDGPQVKVQITKKWTSSVTGKTANAPVEFKLFAIQQDEDGNVIGEKRLMGTRTIKPGDDGSASIDFGYQPYYGTNEQPLLYWVEETPVNGYDCKATSAPGAYVGTQNPKAKGFSFLLFTQTEESVGSDMPVFSAEASYKNDYEGDSKDIEYKKTWNDSDKEMDNSEYRLSAIQFEVWRSWPEKNVNGVEQAGGDEYFDTVVLNDSNNWTYSKKGVKKYAENSSEYSYYIKAGTETAESEKDQTRLYSYTPTQSGGNTDNVLKTVVVKYNKKWFNSDKTSMSWNTFKNMRDLGALPTKIKFIVQRSTDGQNWSNVETGTNYGITIDGKKVAGNEYTIASLTSSNYNSIAATWDKLPKYKLDTKDEYQYRVIETLVWVDGTVTTEKTFYANGDSNNDVLQPANSAFMPETADISATVNGATTTFAVKNYIDNRQMKLTKLWADDNGNRDDTRPASVTLRVKRSDGKGSEIAFTVAKPAQAGKTNSDGTTSDGYRNSTGTVYIPTPAGVKADTTAEQIAAMLNEMYTVSEDPIPPKQVEGGTYTYTSSIGSFTAGDAVSGIYGILCTNTGSIVYRSFIDINAQKTFANDSEWKDLTRGSVRFSLWYQDEKTGAWTKISADEADKDKANYYKNFFVKNNFDPSTLTQTVAITGDTGSVTWKDAKEYFERTSETAGEAQRIVYGVQEELLDESGAVVATTSYQKSNGANPATKGSDGVYKITNTLKMTELTIAKAWKGTDGTAITGDKLKKMVDAGVIPETITFELFYKNADDQFVSTGQTQTYNVKDLAAGAQKWYQTVGSKKVEGVPQYDKNGKAIEYKISEKSWKYAESTTEYDSSTDSTLELDVQKAVLENGKYTVSLTNTLKTKDIIVDKFWDDAEYIKFDKYVRPVVTFTLTATVDGETYDLSQFMTDEERIVTITEYQKIDEFTWRHVFKNLPMKTSKGKTIVYDVNESVINGYTVDTYWDEENTHAIVTNTPTKKIIPGGKDELTPVKVTIKKVAKGKEDPLKGAIFEVTSNGRSFGTTMETDADGVTTFEFDDEGIYIIREKVAPAGYSLCHDEFKVVVKKSDLIDYDYDEETRTYTNYYNLYIEGEDGQPAQEDFTITFKDSKIPSTSDNTSLLIWSGLLIMSLAGVGGTVAARRRKRS